MLTSKHDSFHRKEVATVHICGHYYRLKGCSSFAEVEYIAASLPMMLVAVQVPMQCLLAMHCIGLLAMHCIGFQNGRRHADENVWDHELATSDPLKILETPLYVGSKQTRTKFSHK